MKNITLKYSLFALLFFASCTKLDLKPTDIIDPGKAFRNLNDINMGIIGVYALLDYSQISMNATVADEAMFPTENTVGNSDAFRWLYNPSSGSVTSLYYSYYTAIDRANRTLEGLDALTLSGSDMALGNRYKGELLALRAYLHFELLRAYASAYEPAALGIPYMTKAAIGYPSRATFGEVVNAVMTDLSDAKGLLPATLGNVTRISGPAVSALQARVALYSKNWSDAITYSTEVINTVPLASKAQFPGIWTDATNAGVVWELARVGTTDSRVGDFFFRQTGGIVLYAPSYKLINSFDEENDIRFDSYIRHDPSRTGNLSPYLVNKYIGGTSSAPGLVDIKLFRTAEMYLIRAEAKAELNGGGADDLNTLRGARIVDYTDVTFNDKAELVTAIMEERFKELAFEGHRFYDLKRRNQPVQRLPEDAVNASGAVLLTPQQAQYAFPIPATEVLINKNTVQNPKY